MVSQQPEDNLDGTPRLRGFDSVDSAETANDKVLSFPTTFHGSCPRCHHFHTNVPLYISNQLGQHSKFYCERCSHVLFGLGGSSPHASLASVETGTTLSGQMSGDLLRQSGEKHGSDSDSLPDLGKASTKASSRQLKALDGGVPNTERSSNYEPLSIGQVLTGEGESLKSHKKGKGLFQKVSGTARKVKESFNSRTLVYPDAGVPKTGILSQRNAEHVDEQAVDDYMRISIIRQQKTLRRLVLRLKRKKGWRRSERESQGTVLAGRRNSAASSTPSVFGIKKVPSHPLGHLFREYPSGGEVSGSNEALLSGMGDHFQSTGISSVAPERNSNDDIFQASLPSLEGNSSQVSILSVTSHVTSHVSIKYRSLDGHDQRIESDSESEIAVRKDQVSVVGSSLQKLHISNDSNDSQKGNDSNDTNAAPVESKKSISERIEADDPSSQESDLVDHLRDDDHRIIRMENKLLRLRFRCVSSLSTFVGGNSDFCFTSTVTINSR